MQKIRNLSLALLPLTIGLVACGGGGGSSTPTDTNTTNLTGQFVDAAVANISYRTVPSGLTGRTDTNGFFSYQTGDSIIFSIRGKDLPTLPTSNKITISSFDNLSTTDNPDLGINIATLLQTLDQDNDPSNGLHIPTETEETAELAANLNFDQTSVNFQIDQNTQDSLTSDDGTLVSDADAKQHIADQLKALLTSGNGAWRMYTAGPGETDLSQIVTFTEENTVIGDVYVNGWFGRTIDSTDGNSSTPYETTHEGLISDGTLKLIHEGKGKEGTEEWDVLIFKGQDGFDEDAFLYFDNRQTALYDVADVSVSAGTKWSFLFGEKNSSVTKYGDYNFTSSSSVSWTLKSSSGQDLSGTGTYKNLQTAIDFFNGQGDSSIKGLEISIDDGKDFFLAVSPGEVGLYAHAFKDSFGNIEEDYFIVSENAELMEQIRKAAGVVADEGENAASDESVTVSITATTTAYTPGEFRSANNGASTMQCNQNENKQVGDTEIFSEVWARSGETITANETGSSDDQWTMPINLSTSTINLDETFTEVDPTGQIDDIFTSTSISTGSLTWNAETQKFEGSLREINTLAWNINQETSVCDETLDLTVTIISGSASTFLGSN
jgi:hypothetical protein